MFRDDPYTIVSTLWVAEHLSGANVRILDGSWYLPNMQRDAYAEFQSEHLPGAQFLDIDDVADTNATMPHMLPSPETFAQTMKDLAIGNEDQVIVYDGAGIFSAARVWWMFKYFGHANVAVMDGGLPKWKAERRHVTAATPKARRNEMDLNIRAHLLRSADQVQAAAADGDQAIIDARPAPRFKGEASEPREGLRSGHIPGSRNVPFSLVLEENGTLKTPEKLHEVFAAAGVDLTKPAITTCGSGVTAAILSLALERIGMKHALYDGSWAEWGMYGDREIATGEA